MRLFTVTLFIILSARLSGQHTYWQQEANYTIRIEMDVEDNTFTGEESLIYTNNSPDTLYKAYYHLYFNAFQPGSMMDVRDRNIADPSSKMQRRISELKPDEEGHLHVLSLTQDGEELVYGEEGTILSVRLANPLLPGESTRLDMTFEGQVPLQIRRAGRDNAEGIRYSMSQWYPKLAEYDYKGWHPNPYIGREFYGVWGNFDVYITIDAEYLVGGTGILQNPNEIGHGYQDEGIAVAVPDGKLTWHFRAEKVHDFMWAADPDYIHVTTQVPDGPKLHFLYQPGRQTNEWKALPSYTVQAFEYASKNFGKYPYTQFSVIQGGDGGMEYPMSTLITGNRNLRSLLSVTVHEMYHSWYQGVIGTNESLHPWMDEGFTSYAQDATLAHILKEEGNPYASDYRRYRNYATSDEAEPMTIHSDHYITNRAYNRNAYTKGSVFLHQLGYIIGFENLMTGMRRYFNEWKFRHPTPDDFIRIMEKVSDMELDWYMEHFIHSTNTIDYAIEEVEERRNSTVITLRRKGDMIMPIDLYVTRIDGHTTIHHIPLVIMRGAKGREFLEYAYKVHEDWAWVNPVYQLALDIPLKSIESIEIDASDRLADVNPGNNEFRNARGQE